MKAVVENIYDVLSNDASLSYIKAWRKGGTEKTELIFPFINIGPIGETVNAQSIGTRGSDESVFTVSIYFGQKSRVPELAYYGDAVTGFKGILDIADDLRDLCRANQFNCTFTRPANIIKVDTGFRLLGGEMLWMGVLTLEGRRKEQRVRP